MEQTLVNSILNMKLHSLSIAILCSCLLLGCGVFRQPVANQQDQIIDQMPFSGGQPNGIRFQSPDDVPARREFDFLQTPQRQPEKRPVDESNIVLDLQIRGNNSVPTHQLLRSVRTRPGRYYDPDLLQQDVNELWKLKEVQRVIGPYVKQTDQGVVIDIEVVERQLIQTVKFIGNRAIPDRVLLKETNLSDGQPLDNHEIRMVKHRIEEFYQDKGYPNTQVEVLEGGQNTDSSAVFLIHEDQQKRVWNVEFSGNTIATDARLKSLIESKPGILKVVGGLVKKQEIDQDVLRLTSYYRGLGFFNARIGRDVIEHENGSWVTLRFVIDEGPRYKIRSVNFVGNEVFNPDQLLQMIELKPGADGLVETGTRTFSLPKFEDLTNVGDQDPNGFPEFNSRRMNQDLVSLRDLYGANGFVFSNVEVETRFLEEPGLLDLVYKIKEGEQYRVRNINIHIEGSSGTTRREVALNRLSFQPGDVIDLREIRNSERRLATSQVFSTGQGDGAAPRIAVVPDELREAQRAAGSGTSRPRRSRSRSVSGPSGSGARGGGGGSGSRF